MQENTQIPTKSIADQCGSFLEVHSVFHTIQGEGPFAGHPAVFVRLAGCNLQCPGCDTEYTQGAKSIAFGAIVEMVENWENKCTLVVITGGEPFRQNITQLVRTLLAFGWTVQIETNGTLPPPLDLAKNGGALQADLHVVCSPKTGKVNPKLYPLISAYKYVGQAGHMSGLDGLPRTALGHSARPILARPHSSFKGPVYLQPMDEQDKAINHANTQAVVKSCLEFGHILCLQLHKFVGVE